MYYFVSCPLQLDEVDIIVLIGLKSPVQDEPV